MARQFATELDANAQTVERYLRDALRDFGKADSKTD
jgi:hypothetical protein